MTSRSQAFVTHDKTSKIKPDPNIQTKVVAKNTSSRLARHVLLEVRLPRSLQHASFPSLHTQFKFNLLISHSYQRLLQPGLLPPLRKLALFSTWASINIYNNITCFNHFARTLITDGTILSLARLSTWISAFVQHLYIEMIRGGIMQKQYGYIFGAKLTLTTN